MPIIGYQVFYLTYCASYNISFYQIKDFLYPTKRCYKIFDNKKSKICLHRQADFISFFKNNYQSCLLAFGATMATVRTLSDIRIEKD